MTIRSLFIIDARVADQQTLIDSLPADSQWYLLDADADGIAQMLAVLANYSELESIQIISHGAPGTLYLGNTVLDSDSLTAYSDQLASLGSSLAESGDILLYGCNVAEGEQGQQFVDTLAQLTGADVAASTDLTGSASLGGDWALEFVSGEVESAALAVADYSGALAFITGTDGDDILTATDNIYGDILQGGLGDDTLNGGPGNDNLYGGAGNDNLLGYLGDDYLQGDQDSNLLDGGEGDDNLQAHSLTGQQTLIGGTGSDLLQATGASVNLSGGDGEDRLSASGSFYDLENGISSYVQRGIADLSGGTGDDNLYASQLSNAWLRGDEGIDILSVSAVKSALLEGGAGQDSLLADFSASSSNTLIGESYGLNYHLDGGEDNDTLEASGWAHNLWGLIEITLDGGAGNDILTLTDSSSTENFESYHPNGGVKQALLRGGDGDDRLTASGVLELTMAGGSGSDTFVLTAAQYRAQQLGPQEFATQQSTEENGWDSGNVRVAPRITVISDFDASEGDTLDVGDLLSNAGIGYDNSNPFASGYLKLTQSGADTLLEFAADGAAGEGLARVTVAKLINVDASTLNGANFHPPLPLPGVDHVNHAPTGSVTLGGTAREGETLTATSNLADADGLGEVHYQWLADGMAIEGATGSSLLLSEAQVGKAISVQARYIDASGTAESVTSAATAPAGGILSFPVWDNMGGSHQVTVGDLSGDYHWSVQVIETSRFLTAAVQFHGWQSGPYGDGQAKELRIIDLHTGQVLAGHTLQQDEFFLPSQGRETLIHIGQVEGSTLTIQAYGYGLDASDASLETPVGNTVTLTLPAEFNANYFHVSQYIPPADGTGYVLGWQWDSQSNTSSAMLYRGSNGGTLEPVTLPGSGDSASDAFVYQGQLWLRATSGEWQTPGWSETYYRLDPNHSGAGPNGWVTIDEDAYWNARDLSVGYESVVRDGEYALDLLDLVPQDYMVEAGEDEILALPGGGVLIRMEPESATDGLGYEHWVVFKDNAIIAQKTFTSDAGLNLRSVQAPEDGYVYFQQWNAAITKAATGEFIGITQNTNALSLYRVALADVTSILQAATASQTLAGLAGVEPVQNYTQAQLSNNVTLSAGQFVEIESYIPLAQHIANDTGAIVWSSVYDVSTDEDVYYVARIEANGTVTRTTSLPEEVEEVVIDVDNGVFFLTDWDEQEGNQAFHLDIATGRVVEISQELFLAIEENGSLPDGVQLNLNTAPTGMVTLSGTATQGQTLTASHTLADADGLGTVSYQWLADGVTLDGATGSTLVLGQAQVGKAISVRASYTDGRDQVESVRSSATAAVANVNDAPTGSVLIAGTATQGQTMTVSHTLADVDGLGTVSYQWLANGVAIGGATGNTLVLAQAQVGKAISVKVSYTDGFGTAESKTSAATATVARLKVTLTANNDAYSGTTGDDWVFGMDGNDSLSGLTGNDILDGGTGADVLNGGAGVDTMIGGNGNDTYYVDHASDVVSETSSTGGIDTVIASVTRTLGNYQENLTLSGTAAINGTGNSLANRLVGNAAANVLNGGAGADTMVGGNGNDTYYVDHASDVVSETSSTGGIDTVIASVTRTLGNYQENLTLSGTAAINGTGNALANRLVGNGAANVLNGGTGADTMIGGNGNDTYYVDHASDVVSETSSTGGIDTVIASVTRTLGNYQENLTLSGTAAINGTGNALANRLVGNGAANVLNGGTGADTMVGGNGNDTYYVDHASDVVSETSSTGGIDTVIASVTRTLGNYQENLTLSGTAAINATGNALANRLVGNGAANVLTGGAGNDTLSSGAGNDRLVGGTGKDTLTGGTGNDIFDFNALNETGLNSTAWDVITDFTRGQDKIDLSTLDANTATAVNDAFRSVIGSTSAFTAAGQLKVVNGVLYGNTDADSTAEFAIQLTGITSLSTSDFIL